MFRAKLWGWLGAGLVLVCSCLGGALLLARFFAVK